MFPNLKLEAIAVDNVNVVVFCLRCGQLHWHSSGGDVTKESYGTHESPCRVSGYEIVTTAKTIRKKRGRISPKDTLPRIEEMRALWRKQRDVDRHIRIAHSIEMERIRAGVRHNDTRSVQGFRERKALRGA